MSEREPVIDRLRERVLATRAAAWAAANAETWICSDGHHHPRPATFTHRRLGDEVNRRNPGNDWSSSEIALGIYRLKDEDLLADDGRWNLSPVAPSSTRPDPSTEPEGEGTAR